MNRTNLKQRVERANQNNISRLSGTQTFNYVNDNILGNENKKFQKSRRQCDQQIQGHLSLLSRYRNDMDDLKKMKAKQVLRNFQIAYDKYMNQILKDVKDILENQKRRIMQTIIQDKERQLLNQKQIKAQIDGQVSELRDLKKGLATENHRQYIAKVVLRDFNFEIQKIHQNINRLSYDSVHLRIDQKRKQCYRNDLHRVILCDQYERGREQERDDTSNLHINRDMIKKNKWGL